MIQVDPKSDDNYPYKKHTEEAHREKRTEPCRDGGRSGVMQLHAKKLLEPPEAGRGEEWILL